MTVSDRKLRDFANGVDYLVKHMIDGADTDISRIRAALCVAQTAVDCIVRDSANSARAAAWAADNWARKNPWRMIGLAACGGALAGILVLRLARK